MENTLKKIGLSTKEIKIYLLLLEYGPREASFIAKKTGINRGSIYEIINKMTNKGFLVKTLRAKILLFSAINPEDIVKQIDNEFEKLQQKKSELKNLVPILNALKNHQSTHKAQIQYFDGIHGIKQLHYHILNNAKSVDSFFSIIDTQQPEIQKFLKTEYIKGKIKRKISTRDLCPYNPGIDWYKKNAKKFLLEIRCIDSDLFPTSNTEINLYENFISLTHFDDENSFGVIIESNHMVSLIKVMFEMLWNSAKPI